DQERLPIFVQNDIVRLQVAVYDATFMQILEDLQKILGEAPRLGNCQARAEQLLPEGAPANEALTVQEAPPHLEVAPCSRKPRVREAFQKLALPLELIVLFPIAQTAQIEHLDRDLLGGLGPAQETA